MLCFGKILYEFKFKFSYWIHQKGKFLCSVVSSVVSAIGGLQACNFVKKRLLFSCFPVNIPKILRTPILKNIHEWLLLSFNNFTFIMKTHNQEKHNWDQRFSWVWIGINRHINFWWKIQGKTIAFWCFKWCWNYYKIIYWNISN